MENEKIKDLGFMNGWDLDPDELTKHYERIDQGEKHDVEHKIMGRCYHKYICKTCGISWSVDSGD